MSPSNINFNRSIKFTKGEKCLFAHLIITFLFILLMIIIYFVHLCWVNHTGNDIFTISRRSFFDKSLPESNTYFSEYQSVGLLYLNVTPMKIICNTLLLRPKWSLLPAHCATMRSDPDLAYFLPTWKIMYKIHNNYIETGIKQSLIHHQFNRDDFNYNIGLLRHNVIIPSPENIALTNIDANSVFLPELSNVAIIGWSSHMHGGFIKKEITEVNAIKSEKCHEFVSPVVENFRDYEFCIHFNNKNGDSYIDHGAVLVDNLKIIGLFSWGDKTSNGSPLIFLSIVHFKDWFETIIDL